MWFLTYCSKTDAPFLVWLQEKLMGHLGVVLYEYLGEEYPEVLGSILGALKAIVNVIGECLRRPDHLQSLLLLMNLITTLMAGMHKMTPPIKDLLPRLTPILKNRHEKVQENCIDLVGRIADRSVSGTSAAVLLWHSAELCVLFQGC